MCSIELIFFGLMAGSQFAGGIMEAQGYRAQASQYNRQADIERERTQFEMQRERERHRRVAGTQRATFLASGVSLEGTPADVIVDSALENQIDIEAIRFGGQAREDNLRFSAQQARTNANQSIFKGTTQALSTLVGGLGEFDGTNLFQSQYTGPRMGQLY